MQALIKATKADDYPAEIELVISNRPKAGGLDKARDLGVDAICIEHKLYKTRQEFEEKLDQELGKRKIELVCNAGFMRILSPYFVNKWRGKILNIHPSLLPKYPGLHTHKRVLEAGESEHGCTIHYVDEGMDTGEIIAQAKIDIKKDDTPNSLAERVLRQEHKLYPQTLRMVAQTMLASLY